ncbi:hypothetical protein [Arthrobacter sp. TWP1-1]|uniref:hypothetical protein n=1 Tax=Arthrobacter sp. TWP1-1 TaxID=2804568 RepID=UPI003CF46BA9
MSKQGFDARYPAMFQPGGEQGTTPKPVSQPTAPRPVVVEPETPAPVHKVESPAITSSLAWRLPAALGVVLMAAAVFCFTAQYWGPVTVSFEQASVVGSQSNPWTLILFPLAAPFLTVGLSLLMLILFLFSRQSRAHEGRFRPYLRIIAAGLLIGAWLTQFSPQMFPAVWGPTMVIDEETGMPVSYILSMPLSLALPELAPAFLWVGLLTVAALVAVPKLWQFTEPGETLASVEFTPQLSFLRTRALWVGGLFVAIALAAGFAPRIFPLAAGRTVSQEGGITTLQPWTDIVTALAPCFLAAGLTVLAVTALSTALRTALVRNPRAQPVDVEP